MNVGDSRVDQSQLIDKPLFSINAPIACANVYKFSENKPRTFDNSD